MPEGPEVKLMVETLKKYIKSDFINLEITGGRYIRHKLPKNYKSFKSDLKAKIIDINCKGKFIYIILDNDWTIWITLGMSGHFVKKKYKHTHYTFETSKGKFYMDDTRNFGTLNFYKIDDEKNSLKDKLNSIGFDPLQNKIKFEDFLKHFNKFKKQPNKNIAELLLEQKFIAGIGNYLRSDILYKANINPFTKLKSLNKNKLFELSKYLYKIPNESYKNQKNKLRLHSYNFKIYGRDTTSKGEKSL